MITDYTELLGQALGTCTLQCLLGRGGMGAVYLAQQSRPRRTVAVKVLMPGMVVEKRSRTEFLARFRREADAIAALDHVNILPIYEYGEQQDIAYLVMPYVTGGTLRDLLEKRGMLQLNEIVPIIEQAATGLDSAHAQGIIHRDLKPANILFHADGRVLLADFGLAKVLRDDRESGINSQQGASPLTNTGTIVGTPEYLSPEQGTGQPIDHRSDIYSLSVVLFQMLTGRVPFTGVSPVAVAIKHALEEPPLVSQFNPIVPRNVEAVVMKAMTKNPHQRYASAGEFAEALRMAVDNPGVDLIPPPRKASTERLAVVRLVGPEMYTAPTEAAPPPAQPPAPRRPRAAQPVQARNAEVHNALTEQAPSIAPPPEVHESMSTVILPDESEARVPQPVREPQVKLTPVQVAHQYPQPDRRGGGANRGCQSVSMMLLGSLLTLLIVVSSFAWYISTIPKEIPSKQNIIATQVSQGTTVSVTKTPKPFTAPKPSVSAGSLLYGTDLPGPGCDMHGGEWRKLSNVQVVCDKDVSRLTNEGAQPRAGIFLDTLPSKQPLPNNYILQVQIVNPGSHGIFAIFFRHQASHQGYAFTIDSETGYFQADAYDNPTSPTMLFGKNLQTKMSGSVTLTIKVQGANYTLYANGTEEGNASSGSFSGGGIGLIVNQGANVSFKNLAIYALP